MTATFFSGTVLSVEAQKYVNNTFDFCPGMKNGTFVVNSSQMFRFPNSSLDFFVDFQNKSTRRFRKLRLIFSRSILETLSFQPDSAQQYQLHFSSKMTQESGFGGGRISTAKKEEMKIGYRIQYICRKAAEKKSCVKKQFFPGHDRSGIFDATQECELFDRRNKGSFSFQGFFCWIRSCSFFPDSK